MKINSILRILDRLHWLWLALAAPFMLFPSPKRSLAMLVVPALFLLHWLALKIQKQTTSQNAQSAIGKSQSLIPYTPLNGALLLLEIMVVVSLWVTYDIGDSLPKITGMVLGFGAFFAVVREAEHPHGWVLSLLAFSGIGLGIAVVGVFGTNWFTSKITLFVPITTHLPKFITGLQGAESGFQPNEVAGALIWILPVMIAISAALFFLPRTLKNEDLSAQGKSWQGKILGRRLVGVIALCLAATFFVIAVFILCQSRGSYIGVALLLPVLILIVLPPRWRWYSLALMVVLAIVLGILAATHWELVGTWIANTGATATSTFSLDTLEGRLEIWSRAILGIRDFPLTGMGMNVFRKAMPILYPIPTIPSGFEIAHAHNEYLQAALDLGIPGLIAFLALYICAFWMLADVWKATRNPEQIAGHWSLVTRSLALGLGSGLFAHMLYGLTDAVTLGAKPGILFWMLLGLIVGLHRRAQEHLGLADRSVLTTQAKNGLQE